MTLITAILGGLIGGVITFLLGDYTKEVERRRKLIGLVSPIIGDLTQLQELIENDLIYTHFTFSSFQQLKSSDVLLIIVELLGLQGAELIANLMHIDLVITYTSYSLQSDKLLIESSTLTDTAKEGLRLSAEKYVREARKNLSPDIAECQNQIQNLFTELGRRFSIYSYIKCQASMFIP